MFPGPPPMTPPDQRPDGRIGKGPPLSGPPGPPGPETPGWRPGWFMGRDFSDHDRARAALQAGEVRPLRVVLDLVERQFTGQMVEAELEEHKTRWVYEITMLAPDGSMMKLFYDAASLDLVHAKGHGLNRWYCGDPSKRPAALLRRHKGKGPHFMRQQGMMGTPADPDNREDANEDDDADKGQDGPSWLP